MIYCSLLLKKRLFKNLLKTFFFQKFSTCPPLQSTVYARDNVMTGAGDSKLCAGTGLDTCTPTSVDNGGALLANNVGVSSQRWAPAQTMWWVSSPR